MLVLYLTYIDEDRDKKKFEEIYHSYKKKMKFLALSIVHNESDAEDIVHDVFLNIAIRHMSTINRIDDDTDLRNYLLKATKHTAINWTKKRRRSVYKENENAMEYNLPIIEDNAFLDYICKKMEYESILGAVQELDSKYRDVIYYHFILEIPVPQVAKMLNQTVSATKKQLVRGKKKLLYLLEKGE